MTFSQVLAILHVDREGGGDEGGRRGRGREEGMREGGGEEGGRRKEEGEGEKREKRESPLQFQSLTL